VVRIRKDEVDYYCHDCDDRKGTLEVVYDFALVRKELSYLTSFKRGESGPLTSFAV
jgi:hypothetical protein